MSCCTIAITLFNSPWNYKKILVKKNKFSKKKKLSQKNLQKKIVRKERSERNCQKKLSEKIIKKHFGKKFVRKMFLVTHIASENMDFKQFIWEVYE